MRDWEAQGGQLARFRVFFGKKQEKICPLLFLLFFCWN